MYIYILSLYIYNIHIITYNCSQGRFCTLFFVFLFGGVEWSAEGFPCPWWCLLLRLRCPFLHVPMRGTKERGWEGEKWNWHGWCLPIDATTTYGKLAQCPMIFCHTASTKCLKIYPKHLLQKPLENCIVQGNPPENFWFEGLKETYRLVSSHNRFETLSDSSSDLNNISELGSISLFLHGLGSKSEVEIHCWCFERSRFWGRPECFK